MISLRNIAGFAQLRINDIGDIWVNALFDYWSLLKVKYISLLVCLSAVFFHLRYCWICLNMPLHIKLAFFLPVNYLLNELYFRILHIAEYHLIVWITKQVRQVNLVGFIFWLWSEFIEVNAAEAGHVIFFWWFFNMVDLFHNLRVSIVKWMFYDLTPVWRRWVWFSLFLFFFFILRANTTVSILVDVLLKVFFY